MKKTTSTAAIMLLSLIFISAYSQQTYSQSPTENKQQIESVTDDHQQDFKNLTDRFSYAYGADLAEKFKVEGIELNVELMAAAMQAVFEGGNKLMEGDEIIATMDLYREVHLKKKEAERAIIAEKNKQEGEAFLAKNAKQEGVVVTESGLQYKVITAGDGGYKPTLDDELKVHYRATFVDGTEFDSTHSRNEPYSVKGKQLIDGWAEALQLMSAGAKWELVIPAELAYGEKGSDPYIGPNAVLVFEVELLEIEKPAN